MANIKNIIDIQDRVNEKPLSPKQQAQELKDQLASMEEKAQEKIEGALKHLVDSLNVTAEKYMTANGVMRCLSTLRECDDTNGLMMDTAQSMACKVAETCIDLAKQAEKCDDLDKLPEILDDVYDPEFAKKRHQYTELAEQLCLLDLCAQIGPAIQDVIDFRDAAVDEIENTKRELDELCEKQHVDKKKLK